MKKTIAYLACVWFAAAGVVTAQDPLWVEPMLSRGTQTMSFSGRIDDDGNDVGAALGLSYGRFIFDCVEAGMSTSLGFRGSDSKNASLGVYGTYYFDLGTLVVPHAGVGMDFSYWDVGAGDDTVAEFLGYTGAKYFLRNHLALGSELVLRAATDDVYNLGEDSFDWLIRFFTSWYF